MCQACEVTSVCPFVASHTRRNVESWNTGPKTEASRDARACLLCAVCVHCVGQLDRATGAKTCDQTLFWVCLLGWFWVRLMCEFYPEEDTLIMWVGSIQSVEHLIRAEMLKQRELLGITGLWWESCPTLCLGFSCVWTVRTRRSKASFALEAAKAKDSVPLAGDLLWTMRSWACQWSPRDSVVSSIK